MVLHVRPWPHPQTSAHVLLLDAGVSVAPPTNHRLVIDGRGYCRNQTADRLPLLAGRFNGKISPVASELVCQYEAFKRLQHLHDVMILIAGQLNRYLLQHQIQLQLRIGELGEFGLGVQLQVHLAVDWTDHCAIRRLNVTCRLDSSSVVVIHAA